LGLSSRAHYSSAPTETHRYQELRTVLEFLRKGDVLMVTRIDRLARSIGDLQDIVRAVRSRGASFEYREVDLLCHLPATWTNQFQIGLLLLRRSRQLEYRDRSAGQNRTA
jgi:hypothetical protein